MLKAFVHLIFISSLSMATMSLAEDSHGMASIWESQILTQVFKSTPECRGLLPSQRSAKHYDSSLSGKAASYLIEIPGTQVAEEDHEKNGIYEGYFDDLDVKPSDSSVMRFAINFKPIVPHSKDFADYKQGAQLRLYHTQSLNRLYNPRKAQTAANSKFFPGLGISFEYTDNEARARQFLCLSSIDQGKDCVWILSEAGKTLEQLLNYYAIFGTREQNYFNLDPSDQLKYQNYLSTCVYDADSLNTNTLPPCPTGVEQSPTLRKNRLICSQAIFKKARDVIWNRWEMTTH